ncbi:MAG: sensor histidine kinase/response regulator, partial [Phenylobacterium sp.]|nr:sensor histidine kinase/response regulator [Phenylobacterium sp.]
MPQSITKSPTAAQAASKPKRAARPHRPEVPLETAELLAALRSFRRGDFSVRLPKGLTGLGGELAEAFNDVVELNDRMTKEFDRLGETVGRQGKINHRAKLPGAQGSWA